MRSVLSPQTTAFASGLPMDLSGGGPCVRACAAPDPWQAHAAPAQPFAASDNGFVALQNALRASGGLASGNEVAARLQLDGEAGYVQLARWIVGRQAFSFAWHDDIWLPMFQFDPQNFSLRRSARPILAELIGVMAGWSIAHWFATPNEALHGHRPVELWNTQQEEVFQAARLQRFVMKG